MELNFPQVQTEGNYQVLFFLSLFSYQWFGCFFFLARLFQNRPRRSCYNITHIVLLCLGPLPCISLSHVLFFNLQRAQLQIFCALSFTSGHEDNGESSPMLAFTPFSCITALLLLFKTSWFQMYFFLKLHFSGMLPLYIMHFSIFRLISLFSS